MWIIDLIRLIKWNFELINIIKRIIIIRIKQIIDVKKLKHPLKRNLIIKLIIIISIKKLNYKIKRIIKWK